jgi:nucleotide-binding universal stress UspA family protein
MKVLVGVDGSSNSFAAVEFAGRLLAPDCDQLLFLFATPALSTEEELDPAVEQRARLVLSRAVLEAALERLPAAWRARVEQKEVAGPPGAVLLDAVKEYGAELVVVGFRGTSSLWERFILGSVSRAIVHTAPVSVLVVKSPLAEEVSSTNAANSDAKPIRTLAAYDGPQVAPSMATLLWQFTWPERSEAWVATVVRPMFPFDVPDWVKIERRDPDVAAMAAAWEQEHQQNLQSARNELENFRAELPPCFAKQEAIIVEGRPAEQIVNLVRSKSIDLTVMGSRGSGRVEHLLVGSTTEQVLASAPCSVLVVR